MDKTVPTGAAILLDFVRLIEVGRTDRASYDIIYGRNQSKLPKPITSMTIGELVDAQASFTKRFKSSASGGYQFMRATLQDLARDLGLQGTQIFDPNLQDRLAYHLLKRRGYEEYMAGKISRTEFGKRLAQEWASFPVLAATKGAHHNLRRGQSYYMGDKLNMALVKPERLEGILDQVRKAKQSVPDPVVERVSGSVDADKPILKTKRFWSWLSGGGAGAAMPFVDWRVQMALLVLVLAVTTYSILTMDQARKRFERVVNKLMDEL
ncbi:hypothetical protein [Paenochrobactrum pullorum]|uniref:hypothetical protein n=1 Tax=Paenochrobactrum pullorum TaxID=1324351 RepID=UPI0035BBD700